MRKETNRFPLKQFNPAIAVNSRKFVDKHIHITAISPTLFKRQNLEIAEALRSHATLQVSETRGQGGQHSPGAESVWRR